MDDIIAFSPETKQIADFVAFMKEEKSQKYVLEDLRGVKYYLGIKVHKEKLGFIHLTQLHLISKIINSTGFE